MDHTRFGRELLKNWWRMIKLRCACPYTYPSCFWNDVLSSEPMKVVYSCIMIVKPMKVFAKLRSLQINLAKSALNHSMCNNSKAKKQFPPWIRTFLHSTMLSFKFLDWLLNLRLNNHCIPAIRTPHDFKLLIFLRDRSLFLSKFI